MLGHVAFIVGVNFEVLGLKIQVSFLANPYFTSEIEFHYFISYFLPCVLYFICCMMFVVQHWIDYTCTVAQALMIEFFLKDYCQQCKEKVAQRNCCGLNLVVSFRLL